MINDRQPDVFGVQEGLIEQIAFLDSALTKYGYAGIGRDSLTKHNEYSAVFYRTDKFDLIKSATFWLSETPETPSKGWDARYNRIATWVLLKDRKVQKNLIVLNTHLDHKGEQARLESTRLIATKMKELSGDTLTCFITGDFNAKPAETELFKPISSYMRSVREAAPETDTLKTFNGFGIAQERTIIDYIFFKNATPLKYQTIVQDYSVPFISDHYPIMGVFKY